MPVIIEKILFTLALTLTLEYLSCISCHACGVVWCAQRVFFILHFSIPLYADKVLMLIVKNKEMNYFSFVSYFRIFFFLFLFNCFCLLFRKFFIIIRNFESNWYSLWKWNANYLHIFNFRFSSLLSMHLSQRQIASFKSSKKKKKNPIQAIEINLIWQVN